MKKSRKRMLLSSIAMLLVALIALGSATFAWFSVSKTVTADGMVVKAIATAGLEISNTSATSGFDTTVSFGQTNSSNFSLKPVSWDGATTNGFIPDGNVASPGGAYTGAFKSAGSMQPTLSSSAPIMGANTYVAEYDVWVRSAAEGSTRTAHTVEATVTITGANASFARVKLVDGSTTKAIFADEADASASVVQAAGSTKATYTLTADETATSVTGTDTSTTGKAFKLYVWFDGEDDACVDSAKNAVANVKIEFTATDM